MIDKKVLEETVKISNGYRDVARRLKTNHGKIQYLVRKYQIDCSHFCFGETSRNLINQKFNMLTVISVFKKGRRDFANCNCDCGRSIVKRCDSLTSGKSFSCGCHSKNRWNMVCDKNPSFKGFGEIRKQYYSELKRSAKRRDLEFDVSIEYLWNLYQKQQGKCALTGLPICFGRLFIRHETTASPDRIDNSKGYVEGNIRWVLKDINMIRGDYNTDYFIRLCSLVAKQNEVK